jgi:hypothetical protein
MRAVGRKCFECACLCYDAQFGLLGQPPVKLVLRCDDDFLCLLQAKTGIEGDDHSDGKLCRVQSISCSVIAVSAITLSPMIGHEGALAPRQSETRVLMIVWGLLKAYLFETAAGDLADSVRGDESQVSGAEKGDHEVLRKDLCRLLGPNRKGLPSPFEPLSTKVDG